MASRLTPTSAKRFAIAVIVLNIGMVLVGPVLSIIYAAPLQIGIGTLTSLVYSVFVVLILARQPRHTIGWLFLIVGWFSALQEFTGGLFIVASSIPFELQALIVWIANLAWVPGLMIPITLVLQFFPNGRLPSPRWWPITAAALVGIGGYIASFGLHPWPWEEHELLFPYNPFGIPGSEIFFERLYDFSNILFAIGLLGSLAAVVVRFRRVRGVERAQMKWLVYAAVVGIAVLFINEYIGKPLGLLPFQSLPTLLVVAIGLAILRYRLFDIDILIRRTLIYGALTGTLALVYFVSVILLQQLLQAQNQLTTVLSTLTIAALFSPLRRRIQNDIDRLFFRRRYDAEQSMENFNIRARDEVDLEQINQALLEVVVETMQPATVTLWLREVE